MNEHQVAYADRIVFTVANIFNIFMVIIFYSRIRGISHPLIFGGVWVILILLLITAAIQNVNMRREKWEVILPIIFIVFLILAVVLDYLLKINFRNTWLLGPYLLLYYLSIMGMIGYAFRMGKRQGIITLFTYFMSQIAAIYSYMNVGHG